MNQQKKAEKQFNPAKPILPKKQTVGTNAFAHKSLEKHWCARQDSNLRRPP
jgi:hypothetical protein